MSYLYSFCYVLAFFILIIWAVFFFFGGNVRFVSGKKGAHLPYGRKPGRLQKPDRKKYNWGVYYECPNCKNMQWLENHRYHRFAFTSIYEYECNKCGEIIYYICRDNILDRGHGRIETKEDLEEQTKKGKRCTQSLDDSVEPNKLYEYN